MESLIRAPVAFVPTSVPQTSKDCTRRHRVTHRPRPSLRVTLFSVRRAFVQQLLLGTVVLDADEARHLRDVLRLRAGESIELFDADGRTAPATLARVDKREVIANVTDVSEPEVIRRRVVIASAVPKGERADWLVEKLGECGVHAWQPLNTDRSVVNDAGESKLARWRRIAIETAKQCRRRSPMRIERQVDVGRLPIPDPNGLCCVLSTARAEPMARVLNSRPGVTQLCLLVGPEGGWSEAELTSFETRGWPAARLTDTILRLETAAFLAGAVAMMACPSDYTPGD
jgi:16S rRNA (uracil1498-N3)-methyltransferase